MDCHEKVIDQWRHSLHAKALSPGVLGQFALFDGETIADCLSCHFPNTETGEALGNWSGSVSCFSCHGHLTSPHPSEVPVTRSPVTYESCVYCHQFVDNGILVNGKPLENTVEEWRQSLYPRQGITCISCHLQEGNHYIRGIHDPEMTRSGLIVSGLRNQNQIEITLQNQGAGHALPTYITPRIRVQWKNARGQSIPITTVQRKMDWNETRGWTEIHDSRLQPHEQRTIHFNTDNTAVGYIEIWVDPDADYYERVYPAILKAMNESDVSQESKDMIRSAMQVAGQSSYLLYSLRCGPDDGACQ
ncbi:MAG: cytochrome c family protein [Candidatus Thiodiazotropha lotti]|uniref:Cytochrome c family protein n=1 Tax=Candidatus Thiodiazotropha lotti TaxID=2792787 RepID=A0A9E4K457_9GAMM|nr:cytochrome c family protein [Candidatus Thiodiazotropha lotti]MCW4203181.1 cytochrome c family protein [Candidatus Thiodiazotropha lotti]